MASEVILQHIYNLLYELLGPLDALRGWHRLLKDEAPVAISEQASVVGRVTNQFVEDIKDFREHVPQRIDLSSPTEAAAQMRRLVTGWREYEAPLLDAMQQIQASGVSTGDEELDVIMLKVLPNGLRGVERGINLVENIDADFLTAPLCDGADRLKKKRLTE